MDKGLRNAYFAERNLASLLEQFERIWGNIQAPRQFEPFAVPERS